MLYREWEVNRPDVEKSATLGQKLQTGRLLSDVLVARGMETPEEVQAFLNESGTLSNPFLIRDMELAVSRIRAGIQNEERMVIFGDYDVDGITATALLFTCLESLGADVFYKISNRSDDGYGLSPFLVEQIAKRGISLIITVDNGISANDAAQKAKELGVDLVITDHHLAPEVLPQAAAVVDPCRTDDESPFKNLSGVGVAFMLAAALEDCEPSEMLSEFGDLAAIGTIADVMKLTGENRILVRAGLAALQDTHRPGLAALIEVCGWAGKEITAENISYGIAPRLNAAGRMDDATDALRLLLAEDEEEAAILVQNLQDQNTARQKTEQEIVAEIINQIEAQPSLQSARVLIVWGEGWHQGIIGIVSSRLVDKYAKPAIVISFDGEEGRGSGRSVRGFSLYSAIASCEDILIRFGGHDLAAGFSVEKNKAQEFRERVNSWAQDNCPVQALPKLVADAPFELADATVENVRELGRLAPCGSGNPEPKFLLENAVIDAVFALSEGRHTRLRLRKGTLVLYVVLFGTGPAQLAYSAGEAVDALLVLSVYEGKNGPMVSARAIEIRPVGLGNVHVQQSAVFENFIAGAKLEQEQKALLLPSREETAQVYRALRGKSRFFVTDLRPAFARFGEEGTGRMLASLAALEELGLICKNEQSNMYEILPVSDKRDLSSSTVLKRLEV